MIHVDIKALIDWLIFFGVLSPLSNSSCMFGIRTGQQLKIYYLGPAIEVDLNE